LLSWWSRPAASAERFAAKRDGTAAAATSPMVLVLPPIDGRGAPLVLGAIPGASRT
jgi:hypothetical protein